jgi:hypothetical protein
MTTDTSEKGLEALIVAQMTGISGTPPRRLGLLMSLSLLSGSRTGGSATPATTTAVGPPTLPNCGRFLPRHRHRS